ncbi:MAG TPA: type II toxin-antitoxin system ParD family antitoxin [Rhodospirillales bacterium]
MASMSVSLSERMRGFIRARVKSGEYHNESEYIRDLVRRDQQRMRSDEVLLRELRAAEATGISLRRIPGIVRDMKRRLKK